MSTLVETQMPSNNQAPFDHKPSPDLVSLKEASQILAQRYPSDEELDRFPLGKLLKSIPSVDPRYGKQPSDRPGHIERVIEGINYLLSDHPERIVKEWRDKQPFSETSSLVTAYRKIFGDGRKDQGEPYCRFESREARDAFFRLTALYHDIGKSIITERHPVVGWHLINDVHREEYEKELMPLLLGRDYSQWLADLTAAKGNVDDLLDPREKRLLKVFNEVIRYHDYFGLLSTGEGSLAVMVDLIDLRGVNPKDAQELFSILMIFTLADVFGSVPEVLPQKVDVFCSDWDFLCRTIASDEVHGDRGAFLKALRLESQKPKATIERLWRLMFEGAPADYKGQIDHDNVERVFKETTMSRMYPFIKNFAMFCKLDYCLGFKISLMKQAREKGQPLVYPMTRMMRLLAELEQRYGDLCQRPDGTWRRIGFEMAGLTRRPTAHREETERSRSRIGETIIGLLLKPEELGKEWAVGECTVWFMEE